MLWCLSTYDIKYQQEEAGWILDIDSFFQGINMGVSEKNCRRLYNHIFTSKFHTENDENSTVDFMLRSKTIHMMLGRLWTLKWLVKSPKIRLKNHCSLGKRTYGPDSWLVQHLLNWYLLTTYHLHYVIAFYIYIYIYVHVSSKYPKITLVDWLNTFTNLLLSNQSTIINQPVATMSYKYIAI